NRSACHMKLILRNRSWILPWVCMARLLMGAMGSPCTAQVVEGWALGTAIPTHATTQSPLPAPTGPYGVGRTEFDWLDSSRPDPDSPSGHREIVVWFWYPTSPKNQSEAAEWMPGKWGELLLPYYLSKQKSAGTFLSEVKAMLKEHPISTIRSHADSDAP